MTRPERVLLLGDIHGEFAVLGRAIRAAMDVGAVAVIQVGDFGFCRGAMPFLESLRLPLPVYVIDGNHDEFECIEYSEVTEIGQNLFYVPRGTLLEIAGMKIGFCGGASSVDKRLRLSEGWYWSEREVVTPENVAPLMGQTLDLLVTHCPPQSVIQKHFSPWSLAQFGLPFSWRDPSADLIEQLWDSTGRPQLFCGHMHKGVADSNVRILNINEGVLYERPREGVDNGGAGEAA